MSLIFVMKRFLNESNEKKISRSLPLYSDDRMSMADSKFGMGIRFLTS